MTKLTIQALAEKYASMFCTKIRKQSGDRYACVIDLYSNEPDYYESDLHKLIKDAHADMLPDDYKFDFIVQALDAIAECSADLEDISIEPDIYNFDLFKWVQSHGERQGYCNEVLAEYGHGICLDFMAIIAQAQQREKEEVLHSVLESLRRITEEST